MERLPWVAGVAILNAAGVRFAWALAASQLKIRYRHTTLGIAWTLLEPLLYLGVLSLVFSAVNGVTLEGYAAFVFCGLVPWRYLESSATSGMESIVGGDWLLKKMYVSASIFPVARWLTASIEFALAFVILMTLVLWLRPGPPMQLVTVPLAVIVWAAGALGLGMVLAVAYTFFRDIKPIAHMVLLLAFFSSPILIMPGTLATDSLPAALLRWHPLTYFTALFQKPLYFHVMPSMLDWGVSAAVSASLLLAGAALIRRFGSKFYFFL